MSKKTKKTAKQQAPQLNFDPQKSKYYTPFIIAVMLIGVIILFRDFLFSDKMLYGSDTINAGIFFRHLYVEYFKMHGAIPVWNPYIFGGIPFIDAFHGDIYYPLSILKFVGNFYRMLGLNLVIHIFLAGIFMYFAARQFKLSKIPASVAAFGYMFSGFLVSLVAPGHDGKIFVTTLFPLVILFLDRAFERKPILNFTLLGLVIGVIILSPHPQLSYYMLWVVAFYGVFKLINVYRETKSLGKVIKPGILLAAAVVIGLFISAVQFYPGYVYTKKYSPRADTKRGYDWATSWSMNEEEAVSLVVPEFSGTSGGEGMYYWGKNVFKDNSEYAGVISLFLAVIGVFFYRKKEAIFFGSLALFAFIYALGGTTPIFRIFYYLIPSVKSLRAPSTIMFIFLFSVSLLAGMGVQYLISRFSEATAQTKRRLKIYLISVPAGLLLLALLFAVAGESLLSAYTSIFYTTAKTQEIQQGVTKWTLAVLNLPHIKAGFWIVFLFTTIVSGTIMFFISRKAATAVLLIIPLMIMIDGIRFDSRFIKTYDYRPQFTSNRMTEHINSLPGKYRVLNLKAVGLDYLPYFGTEVVVGYHGNQLRWYDDLLGGPGLRHMTNPRFLNLVGARYLLVPAEASIPGDYFGPDSLTINQEFGQVTLYENPNAFPRVFLVNDYEVVPERKDITPLILGGPADLSQTVYLEKEPPILPDSGSVTGTARIASYSADSVLVDINTDQNTLLVLTDNYYYAWQAYADGKKTDILRADGAFRAVPVKAGTKQLLFKYNRAVNNPAKYVTLLTLLLVAVILIVYLVMYIKDKKRLAPAV
ncbi:MAG TPA: hypothetical protein ENH25_08290 [candidate division Zixibacteria bacterium]|nr:hypothetical protein [candidate division Zixibacteria bacterium]